MITMYAVRHKATGKYVVMTTEGIYLVKKYNGVSLVPEMIANRLLPRLEKEKNGVVRWGDGEEIPEAERTVECFEVVPWDPIEDF